MRILRKTWNWLIAPTPEKSAPKAPEPFERLVDPPMFYQPPKRPVEDWQDFGYFDGR